MDKKDFNNGLRKEYEAKSGKEWMVVPVSHGEIGFASWDYQLWLEMEITKLRGLTPDKILEDISDEHIIACARIAQIDSEFYIERFGGRDNGGILVKGKSGRGKRSLRIYYNGSDTKIVHDDFTVIEYCFAIYHFLLCSGYDIYPNKNKFNLTIF